MKPYRKGRREVTRVESAEYAIYIASAKWRLFRQQVLFRDKDRCVLCNDNGALEVHHRTYERLGKEQLEDCYTLCPRCHEVVTNMLRRERYANRPLPQLTDVQRSTPTSLSTREQSIHETRTGIQDYRRSTPDHAQWTTRESFQRLCKGNEED